MMRAPSRLEFEVAPEDAGVRLDVLLAGHPAVGSRAQAQRLIDAGRATVDGAPRPKRHRVAAGECVTLELETPPSHRGTTAIDVPFEVVHEDSALLVVDKPAGVVVHPAPGHREGTLAQALAGRTAGGAEPWRPGIVHRLDRDTSGLMVVAKSDRVHRALQDLIRQRKVEREYLVLVDGHLDARSGTIEAPIGRDRRRRTIMSTATDKPREARTHFTELERLARTTLLRVRLETGRTHQIRAHFAALGHPVSGDATYGSDSGCRLGLSRQFLHSRRLRFRHPEDGNHLDCESKPPAELRRALEAARREQVSEGPDGDYE
jgi:23S rRNA pseudouridine1911/1915/1917 synthase